jgi:hypothetical protein
MEAAGEPPPGKEPVMRVMRRAAVLMVLLGLSLGTPGIFAAPARSRVPRPAKTAARSGVLLFDALWGRVAGGWIKEGPGIDPLGRPNPSNGTQTQNIDAGPGIDPWG